MLRRLLGELVHYINGIQLCLVFLRVCKIHSKFQVFDHGSHRCQTYVQGWEILPLGKLRNTE